MRFKEIRTEEEQLDEILPLIPMAAGFLARKAAGAVAKKAGKALMKKAAGTAVDKAKDAAVGYAAKKAAGYAAKKAGQALGFGKDDEPEQPTNDPNAKVGTQPATPKTPNTTTTEPQAAKPQSTASTPMGADADLRTGGTVDLPTNTPGGKKQFKVTRAQGDDVEIEDPQAKPGEPKKMVYKKDDLQRAMNQ